MHCSSSSSSAEPHPAPAVEIAGVVVGAPEPHLQLLGDALLACRPQGDCGRPRWGRTLACTPFCRPVSNRLLDSLGLRTGGPMGMASVAGGLPMMVCPCCCRCRQRSLLQAAISYLLLTRHS